MGWDEYTATHYKNGSIDVKAELDPLFTQEEHKAKDIFDSKKTIIYPRLRVLKSQMVGTTYYAAVEATLGTKPELSAYGMYPKREVFAEVVLTHTNGRQFAYKEMHETECPCGNDCPKEILDLLTPTDNELANKWRKQQLAYNKEKTEDEVEL